jgi:hypothetical protein
LTVEREKFAKAEKGKHRDDGLSGTAMLDYLQSIFKIQFPKNSFHDAVLTETNETKKKTTTD